MTAPPLPLEAEAQFALSGFLRDVERRAAVFAELLCGSAGRGDQAVAAAMLAFRKAAVERPLPDWDVHFWRLLLATAPLRRPHSDAYWAAPLAGIAAQGNAMRAVLLLHLLVGLDEAQSAAALGVGRELYVRAMQRAALSTAGSDGAALATTLQQRLRQLPAPRLVRLARQREEVLRGGPVASLSRRVALRGRGALVCGVGACVLAFAASFLFDGAGSPPHGVRPRALPAAARPLETFDADFGLMTHRDFEQLTVPGDQAALDDPGFYAWYVAQAASATGTSAAPPRVELDTHRGHAAPEGVRHRSR